MTKSIRIDAEADDEISHAIDRYERERNSNSFSETMAYFHIDAATA